MPFGAASSNYRQGVELLKGDVGLPAYTLLPNSEYLSAYLGSESARDNLLALVAEEGRGHATKCPGEALAASEPGISEWGNPAGVIPRHPEAVPEGNRGT
jgi:hypothetical protein